MSLEDALNFLESSIIIKFLIPIIIIICLIVILAKVWDNEKNTREICNKLDELEEYIIPNIISQTRLLERIAQALEQEEEPYIIENEKEDG